MTVQIGTPQYGGKKKNNSRLVDGNNIYRILPPIGELAKDGVWAVYECLHWGFKGSKGMRPFRCIQKKDFKTKMVKVQCPECDRILEKTTAVNARKMDLEKQGKTKAEVDEHLKPLTDWLFSHNLDKKWYVNALTMDGKITRLAIPHKMYVQLQEKISELVTKGIDPIAVDGGVWFNLKRSGTGNQTSHTVSVEEEMVMAEVNGKKQPLPVTKRAPLTQEVIDRLGNEAHDLKNSFRSIAYDDIKRLVSSNGDPDVVDAVFTAGEFSKDGETGDEPEAGTVASTPSKNVALLAQSNPTLTATESTSTVTRVQVPADTANEAANAMRAQFEAQMRDMQAKFDAELKRANATPTTPKPDASKMSDDDFIKQYGFSK